MGNSSVQKTITAWIDEIPDSKLEGGIRNRGPVYKTTDLRLDCQETILTEPLRYNLQVQVNNGCKHNTLKKIAPGTVAWIEAPVNDPWSAERIREELKATVTGFKLGRPGNKLDSIAE